ncbi:MAG TPA: LON peptidase substrate-binding domain-containing protein [Gammaproteobacteria bacterium]
MSLESLPLFPLHTVLFPGGVLPLRIFEPRYLDLVSDCLRNDQAFGVCLISAGHEVGAAAEAYQVGTSARIQDWDNTPEGLLAVTVRGERRFRIMRVEVRTDQLSVAEIEWLADVPECALPVEYAPLARLLEHLLDDLEPPFKTMPRALDDTGWVGARLIELLPLDPMEKQALLELDDPLLRLATVAARLGKGK